MSKRVSHHKPKEREKILNALFSTARSMGDGGAVEKFIIELLTESEQLTIGRRILIAQMILSGKSQAQISYELSVSPNTFSRTRKWLEKQLPNYGDAISEHKEKLDTAKDAKIKQRKHIDPTSFAALRRKYPAHFLLFTIAEGLFKKVK